MPVRRGKSETGRLRQDGSGRNESRYICDASAPARPMIPLSDENPTLHTPVMTWALLGAMFAVWLAVQGAGFDELQLAKSICNYGMVPGELTHRAALGLRVPIARGLYCVVDNDPINKWTPLTSMFLHGGWSHILGNALFFWVFGNNIEDSMGPVRFLAFYLICGLAAAGTHILLNPGSAVPTVGASGAISGVLCWCGGVSHASSMRRARAVRRLPPPSRRALLAACPRSAHPPRRRARGPVGVRLISPPPGGGGRTPGRRKGEGPTLNLLLFR